ncbi:NADP-dependent oxidoreductase domain-containing protein [Cladochytrium replicatum]|nr:NADP-dependent oxidoreductase domain-containing protein [Cladochytrium replicatum]
MNSALSAPPLLRHLGRNGPKVNAMGFGAMGLSDFYGPIVTEEEGIQVLNRVLDLGCSFIDTSDAYGIGANEELLSKVLKERREDVFLCTKFSIVRSKTDPLVRGIRGDREYVKSACEASLERLGIDCIDLYYQHRVDPNTPIEETVAAMAELVKEGKVKYLGLSEASAETIRRAHAVYPITAYQVEYSPWTLDIENDDRLSTCRELGIAIVAYSPLGRGFLTGAYKTIDDFANDDARRFMPRFQGENFAKNLEIVDEIKALAEKNGATAGQLCLAWVLAQGEDFFVIPGTKKIKYLEENVQALNIKLSDEEIAEVRATIAKLPAAGLRYPEVMMSAVNI